ncbi:MAG: WYL domain-containing protein [Cytophagales bacterium]|nr:MAG: WYL domain-containing protein [Cytophagales bacterium]
MPINKDAYARYRIIDDVLNYKKYVDLLTLKEACERRLDDYVSDRTLKKDIADMKLAFDAPIEFDRYNKGYYYTQPFSMQTTIPLKNNDLMALHFAVSTLNQFENIPILADFKEAVHKIAKAIQVKQQTFETTESIIQFEKMPYFKGIELLNDFTTAIVHKKKVSFDYEYFEPNKKNKKHILHPYLLKEYWNRWYVTGYHETYQQIRTFGLDRINNLVISEEEFWQQEDFDANIFFKNALGITVLANAEPEEIILLFDKQQGKYIETQPIHETQTTENTENGLIVKFKLMITYELVAEILSHGDKVVVVQPQKLVDMVKNSLQKSLSNYGK